MWAIYNPAAFWHLTDKIWLWCEHELPLPWSKSYGLGVSDCVWLVPGTIDPNA